MSVLALAWKEVEHHGLVLFGALVLLGSAAIVSWVVGLSENYVTLMTTAVALVAGGFPFYAVFVAGRLVVHDHEAGTHEFLAALPVGPVLRTTVRFVLGLAVLEGSAAVLVTATSLLAGRREGVPLSFLATLVVLVGGYVLAWYAVAFAVAHTGRYRWLVWWVIGLVATTVYPWGTAWHGWTGLLADGADLLRTAPPWNELPGTLAWTASAVGFAYFVATFRGGALLERWFVPASGHQKAWMIGLGLAAMLFAGTLEGEEVGGRGFGLLPTTVDEPMTTVRAAASPGTPLVSLAKALGVELLALGPAVGVERWPEVVLLRARPAATDPRVEPAQGSKATDAVRVLQVDPTLPERAALQWILADVLGHTMAGSPDADADARWLAEGLARWWIHDDPDRLAALAALGAGSSERDFLEVSATYGPEVAGAVAWAGLVALEDVGGREAVLALGQELVGLDRWSGAAWPAVAPSWRRTGPGWVGRVTGVDEVRWRAAWEARMHRVPAPEVPPMPHLTVTTQGVDLGADVALAFDTPWPAGVAIEWVALDALQRAPVPSDRVERLVPEVGATTVALAADVEQVVVARTVVAVPGLGRITGPWTLRP